MGLDADSTRILPGTRRGWDDSKSRLGKPNDVLKTGVERGGNRLRPPPKAPELSSGGSEPRRDGKVAQYALRAGGSAARRRRMDGNQGLCRHYLPPDLSHR